MASFGEMGNSELIESLYAQFLKDPKSVDPSWRHYFQQLEVEPSTKQGPSPSGDAERIRRLIEAYRTDGHFLAQVNCISLKEPLLPEQLRLDRLGFQESELLKTFPTLGLLSVANATLQEIIDELHRIYCHHFSVEYKDLRNLELKEWIQRHVETPIESRGISVEQQKYILESLNLSEFFETFLHTKFIGQKRFSLEGGETLIPMMGALLDKCGETAVHEIVIGMAHRGRLNVLGHILQKPYVDIFKEFDEDYIPESFEGTGDVKYHKGYVSESVTTHSGKKVKVTLTPNPSHLESVDPVVEGQARAKQTGEDGKLDFKKALPLLIHGDAALSGQGVVYETLQFYLLAGYSTGGTIHIVTNNQIGFTTWPRDSRSTHYCTDIAHTFDAPIFHVNAEDPALCVWAALLALEIRQQFHCDVFIDLNCYRKYGHNETDEPAFTQPLEYQIIKKKPSIRTIYKDQLIQAGVVDHSFIDSEEKKAKNKLQEAFEAAQSGKKKPQYVDLMVVPDNKTLFAPFPTQVSADVIKSLAGKICTVPKGFAIHPKIDNLLKDRLSMADGKKPIDWGMGETLAYATLLSSGTPVRIAGQDSCRGTFSHRHAMWVDQKNESLYYPLAHLGKGQGYFEIINSSLSEMAAVGFEYGYSLGKPKALVIWEAQFGDFCNGAQVIFDQYIASGEQKWGQKSNLTLLLPHGYEGQGPEHSSGRMERFLALCGHDNMQVVNPTTPAQLFHLLRRQALRPMHKPLVVFTPKGLLRHPLCVSRIEDLTKGAFEEIIDDTLDPSKVKKLIFCSGRIYYDVLEERTKRKVSDIALVRVEQLYPLNLQRLKDIIKKYKGCSTYVWAQEEPKNMGAWNYIRPYLEEAIPKTMSLGYAGREVSASPATGSHSQHLKEFTAILKQVFES